MKRIKRIESVINPKTTQDGLDLVVDPLGEKHTCTLVWLAGLGDTGDAWLDFFNTKKSPVPATMRVRLLTAPTVPVTVNKGRPIPSWFDITAMDFNKESINFEEALINAKRIQAVLDEEIAKLDNNSKNVFIGGFSQGCTMALHIRLTTKHQLGGVVGLSGFVFLQTEINEENLQNLKILLCHGLSDVVIPKMMGEKSYQLRGLLGKENVEWKTIPDLGHGANVMTVKYVKEYWNGLLLE